MATRPPSSWRWAGSPQPTLSRGGIHESFFFSHAWQTNHTTFATQWGGRLSKLFSESSTGCWASTADAMLPKYSKWDYQKFVYRTFYSTCRPTLYKDTERLHEPHIASCAMFTQPLDHLKGGFSGSAGELNSALVPHPGPYQRPPARMHRHAPLPRRELRLRRRVARRCPHSVRRVHLR